MKEWSKLAFMKAPYRLQLTVYMETALFANRLQSGVSRHVHVYGCGASVLIGK